MKKTKRSDFILVFDRYFSRSPNAVLSVLKRAVYGGAECVCMMFCLLGIYDIFANPFVVAACCLGFTAAFSIVFCFVKKRIAIPIFVLVSGMIIYSNREEIWDRFNYFIDAVFRAMDGNVFSMRQYLWHIDISENVESEIIFTLVGVSCVLALICAGSMFKKPNGAAPLITFVVLFAPMVVAQNLRFNLWVIPTAALLLGGFAAAKAFSSGVITRGGVYEGCRRAFKSKERVFSANAARATAINRAKMNAVYYSKYFSAAVCAASIFTVSGFVGASVMSDKTGIDYGAVYDFFADFGHHSSDNIPGNDDFSLPDLGYFTDEFNRSLGILSPGENDREVLRISNSGEEVYLRGDIGVVFNRTGWSSPTSGLFGGLFGNAPKSYRPAELFVLKNLEDAFRYRYPEIYRSNVPEKYLSDGELGFVKFGDISVEYLTDTNVVFLPAYVSSYSKFYGDNYNLYGDFVVRSKNDKIDTLKYTALVPTINYTGYDAGSKEQLIGLADVMSRVYNFADNFDTTVVPDWSSGGIYRDYQSYVKKNYLDVPGYMRRDLEDFLDEHHLCQNSFDGNQALKYKACVEVADYLKNNYTYSLDTENGKDNPVMSFLTETKSGHCALYASSMTLLLRTAGIPARYCTGFIAPHTNEGETALIRARNLHAWCEVYFDEIGWITFDPTSAAINGQGGGGNTPTGGDSSDPSIPWDNVDNYDDTEDSDDDTGWGDYEYDDDDDDDDDDTDDDDDDGDDITYHDHDENEEVRNFLPIVIAVVFAAVAAGVIIALIRRFRALDREAKKALEQAKTHGNCEELYAKMIAVLELCGFKQNPGEQPEQFMARIDRHFKTKLSEYSELLMRIAFGNCEFTGEELFITAALLKTVFDSADSELVAIGRFKLRKIIINKMLP
ncbi:MAG: transglutaminase domain-containing protein [Oscillospiraceae bacterium]|nr:transglutaminase domain-containing protein [Oscillospiraceae bacterium]